jgi:DNA invertase Pin-like site-specific DNA recombinase
MTIFGYIRVSTRRQGESGLGLEAQRAAITARYPQADIRVEVKSAGTGKSRPVLEAVLAELGDGDVLVVSKLDRLARSVADFGALLDRARHGGWSVVVLDVGVDTGSANGRLVAGVLVSVAQWERELIGQRQRESADVRRDRGVRCGKATALESSTVARIADGRAAGCSWAAIADGLNAAGVLTPTGRAWTRESVRSAAQVGDGAENARRRAAHARGRAA